MARPDPEEVSRFWERVVTSTVFVVLLGSIILYIRVLIILIVFFRYDWKPLAREKMAAYYSVFTGWLLWLYLWIIFAREAGSWGAVFRPLAPLGNVLPVFPIVFLLFYFFKYPPVKKDDETEYWIFWMNLVLLVIMSIMLN